METTAEKLPPYTVEQIEEIAVREASKLLDSVQRYETQYDRIKEHLEDLSGAWVLGAMEATKKINPEISGGRGYQFASGRGKMLDRLNEIKAELDPEDVSLHKIIGESEDGEEIAWIDTIEDEKSDNPAAVLWESLDRAKAMDLLALLDERQRAIVVARYIDDKPQHQVAEEMGLTAGRVSQIETEVRAILRKAWAA